MSHSKWTREETILALALYCRLPFGKVHHSNPQVIQLAGLIGRTPSAVSMKICNFGRFDPELAAKGIVGLKHGSHLDEEIWNEFYQNMGALYEEADKVSGASKIIITDEELLLPIGESITTTTQARKGQAFFRSAVLSAYDNTCCVTHIKIPNLLQASHIKSWRESDPATERTNPINGLCLNVLHHKAFDSGIITIDTDYRVIVSKSAKERYTSDVFNEFFVKYEGQKITLPARFLPSKDFIEYHNSKLVDF